MLIVLMVGLIASSWHLTCCWEPAGPLTFPQFALKASPAEYMGFGARPTRHMSMTDSAISNDDWIYFWSMIDALKMTMPFAAMMPDPCDRVSSCGTTSC